MLIFDDPKFLKWILSSTHNWQWFPFQGGNTAQSCRLRFWQNCDQSTLCVEFPMHGINMCSWFVLYCNTVRLICTTGLWGPAGVKMEPCCVGAAFYLLGVCDLISFPRLPENLGPAQLFFSSKKILILGISNRSKHHFGPISSCAAILFSIFKDHMAWQFSIFKFFTRLDKTTKRQLPTYFRQQRRCVG